MTFQMSDVFLPNPEEVFAASGELEGTVVAFSDSGNQTRVFAVIEVIRKREVIVAIDKLRLSGATLDD